MQMNTHLYTYDHSDKSSEKLIQVKNNDLFQIYTQTGGYKQNIYSERSVDTLQESE